MIRLVGPTVPNAPFAPVMQLFLSPADSDLQTFAKEVHLLVESNPSLVGLVEADLDRHGLGKKAVRITDAKWMAERSLPLGGMKLGLDEGAPKPKPVELEQGRPRTPGYVVLMATLLRGYFGAGFKACDSTTMMLESITLRVFFANLGLKMPGRSTLTELINAVGNATRQRLLDAQVAQALHLKLDDFETMLQDSTHVEGNTAWPTDSRLIVALTTRLLRVGAKLNRVQLPVIESSEARTALADMVRLDREIELGAASPERQEL